MQHVIRGRHESMGTFFEAILVGGDAEHLIAVMNLAWEEVSRLDHLLSRFAASSEISRINRTAGKGPVRIDMEMFQILKLCEEYGARTRGYFDVTLGGSRTNQEGAGASLIHFSAYQLDSAECTVQLWRPAAMIDLGGFAKGYALDRLRGILTQHRVGNALLHGGTSSVLGLGGAPSGEAWPVGIGNPASEQDPRQELSQVALRDRGLSCSAALFPGSQLSDIVVPQTGQPLTEQTSCVVLAPTALEAEILSTALLSMGRAGAAGYIEQQGRPDLHVGWIDVDAGKAELRWLSGNP